MRAIISDIHSNLFALDAVMDVLRGADMIFIACGMGGGISGRRR